jgi:hypothetical protein
MPTTIPEWFRPGPEFLEAPKIGNPYKIYSNDGSLKQICVNSDTILFISLFLHVSIIAISLFAIIFYERSQTRKRKTNALRYAPPLTK